MTGTDQGQQEVGKGDRRGAGAGEALLSYALPRPPPSRLLASTNPPLRSVFGDDPHRVDYAGHVAQDRQQDVDPELLAHTLPKTQNPLS